MSPNAEKLLAWCREHTGPANGRPAPVVRFWWTGVAQALGLASCEGKDWGVIWDALCELHTAGNLAYFDEGLETYGHTSTMLMR